jgi:RNA polymerase sigma factor (sigma-70 family)
MNLLPDDDTDLLARLQRREAPAFEQLMRRYNRLVFRAARGIVVDDAEAQDVVQETWIKAFLSLDGFRGEARLSTWLVRIAIRQALDQQRRLGRLVYWDDDYPAEELVAQLHDASDPATPEDEAHRSQLRQQLEHAIDLLPPLYRSVFIMRAVEGVGVEDTAAALQISTDVVKTRFLRARAMLRARLQGEAGAEAEAPRVHDFLGWRCDEAVSAVLARLRAAGAIRDQ